jgi:hypothetical protein
MDRRPIEVSSPGYETAELTITFPNTDPTPRIVFLELNNDVGSVTIESTRTGREIEDSPSRVEAIDEEEIDEKINMRPGKRLDGSFTRVPVYRFSKPLRRRIHKRFGYRVSTVDTPRY